MRVQLLACSSTVYDGASLIMLYCRTSVADGDVSVCLRVKGVWSYVYIPIPSVTTESPVDIIESTLERRNLFVSSELVTRTDANGFNMPDQYWKLTLRNHYSVRTLRDGINTGAFGASFSRRSYLSDFPYESLAQVDIGVPNCGWADIDNAHLVTQCITRMSNCVREYELTFAPGVITPVAETLYASIPSRLRVMSLDIECAGRRGVFPDPLVDPIIQIGSIVYVHGDTVSTRPLSFTIYTWRAASTPACGYYDIGGVRATYVQCASEHDMIARWVSEAVVAVDVDVFTGWNIDDFDLPYIIRRANVLPHRPSVAGLGRRIGAGAPKIEAEPSTFSSKQRGTRESFKLKGLVGRNSLDMYADVTISRKERSYKLEYIARAVLACKDAYEATLIESAWLRKASSVQVLGLGAKACSIVSPLFSADNVHDRDTVPITLSADGGGGGATAGEYRLQLSRENKSSLIFLRFFDSAGVFVGFACCPRASDEHKEDVHHTMIAELWNGSDDDRQRLAIYNLRDAILPWRIMCELRTLGNYIEMARVTRTDITTQLQRGQNVKSTMLLQWECSRAGFIVPYLPPRIKTKMGNSEPVSELLWLQHELDDSDAVADADDYANGDVNGATADGDGDADSETADADVAAPQHGTLERGKGTTKYTGGYVGTMKPRFYGVAEPIVTLDFASLYPSLMMSENLCLTTYVHDRHQLARAGLTLENDCKESPIAGVYFVKETTRRGLLPIILDQILTARRQTKRAMAAATESGERLSCDGRQLALKVTANSIYGMYFTITIYDS